MSAEEHVRLNALRLKQTSSSSSSAVSSLSEEERRLLALYETLYYAVERVARLHSHNSRRGGSGVERSTIVGTERDDARRCRRLRVG